MSSTACPASRRSLTRVTLIPREKIEVAKLGPGDVLKLGEAELTAEAEGTDTDVTLMTP